MKKIQRPSPAHEHKKARAGKSVQSCDCHHVTVIPEWRPALSMLGDGGGCIGPGCGSSGGSTPPSWLKSQAAWTKLLGDGGGCIGPGCLSSAAAHATRPGSVIKGIGCTPDPMDRRDWSFEEGVKKLKLSFASKKKPTSSRVHLGDAHAAWSIVDDQGPWNTCTACVVTAALEYSRIRAQLPARQLSHLFLYHTTRFYSGSRVIPERTCAPPSRRPRGSESPRKNSGLMIPKPLCLPILTH